MRSRRSRPGDPLYVEDINEIQTELARLNRVTAAPPLIVHNGPAGLHFAESELPGFWAKLTGGSNPYDWTEQIPDTAGGWIDGPRSGTTTVEPAYEVNGNVIDTTDEPIVWLFRPQSVGDEWRFQLELCA